MSHHVDRRSFLASSLLGGSALALAGVLGTSTAAASPVIGDGPYGPLGGADSLGVRLPEGFTARVVATGGQTVQGTDINWHIWADGGATFATDDGGWVYVSNCEAPVIGGVGALRFSARGDIIDAYRILSRTSLNCAGGLTPWGTWLSCEEYDARDEAPNVLATVTAQAGAPAGRVWECNPFAASQGVPLPALGLFHHEAAVVDPATGWLYMTEDRRDGLLYRFRPDTVGDLSSGVLEAADVAGDEVTWLPVPDPVSPTIRPVDQFAAAEITTFARGEGMWYHQGVVYFTTTGDNRVWELETATDRLGVIYDASDFSPAPLRGVDNITVDDVSGDIYVAEDGGSMQLVLLSAEGEITPFMQIVNEPNSEITGPAFSPDGTRLYFSSQRGGTAQQGRTIEVTGPFRGARPAALVDPDDDRAPTDPVPLTPANPGPVAPRFTGGRARARADISSAFGKVGSTGLHGPHSPAAASTPGAAGLVGGLGIGAGLAAGIGAIAAWRNRATANAEPTGDETAGE